MSPIESDVSFHDVDKYLNAEYIEECSPQDITCYMKVFTVVETRAGADGTAIRRRRFIGWPQYVNEVITAEHGRPGAGFLPTAEEMAAELLDAEVASVGDMPQGFCQFELDHAVRAYFGFMAGGKFYRMRVMTMGFCKAPEVNQAAMLYVREQAGVRGSVYIDGIRLMSQRTHARRDVYRFLHAAREVGMTIKFNDPSPTGIFCGIQYDCTRNTVALSRHMQAKALAAADILTKSSLSWAAARAAYGRVYYAAAVLHFAWHRAYHLLKWHRRRSASRTSRQQADLWPSAQRELHSIRSIILLNKPITVMKKDHPQWMLVTDAAKKGCGAVLMDTAGPTVKTWARDWTVEESVRPIHERELLATVEALRVFAAHVTDCTVRIFIDNTGGLCAARSRRAVSFELNAIVGQFEAAAACCRSTTLEYIKSEENIADPLSRGAPLLNGDVRRFRARTGDGDRAGGVVWRDAGDGDGPHERDSGPPAHQRPRNHMHVSRVVR
jgi:hypothetical protein